jgi:hypothetical protein
MSLCAGSALLGTVCRHSIASVAGTVGVATVSVSLNVSSLVIGVDSLPLGLTASSELVIEATDAQALGFSGPETAAEVVACGAGTAFTPRMQVSRTIRSAAKLRLESPMMK